MVRFQLRKLAMSLAAIATAFSMSAPAFAGGGHVSVGYYGGYYGGGYHYAGHRSYGRHRHYRRHRGHHGGGGKAAAIALGVVGGAIILNELAEERARQRAYEDRYYDRYERYSTRAAPYYPQDDRDYLPGNAPDDYKSDGPVDGNLSDDLEEQLEGARNDGGPAPIRLSYEGAYSACLTHARNALGDRGIVLSAPCKPETAEDFGVAWKMTPTGLAARGAESWSRAMYCEADEGRVYLLELI